MMDREDKGDFATGVLAFFIALLLVVVFLILMLPLPHFR